MADDVLPDPPLWEADEPHDSDHQADDAGDRWADIPSGVLPDVAREFVAEAATAIGCTRAHVATPLLAALGAAVGTKLAVEVKPGWLEYPLVWSAVVADSGGFKSPAMRAALQFVKAREHAAGEDAAGLIAEHELELDRYAADRDAWRREAAKGRVGDPPRKPERPPLPRYLIDDTTVEALAPILADNPAGVLLAKDELGGWLSSFDRYSGKAGGDAARWLSMFTAEPLSVDRKGGGRTYVPAAAVSICGCIPPRTFAKALGSEHVDNGLLPRFIVAMPPRRRKEWTEASVGFATRDAVSALFGRLYSLQPGDTGPRVAEFDAAGREAWIGFYDEHAGEQAAATGLVASMLSKIEAYAARLALIVHACRPGADPRGRISASSVKAGVALARWYAAEARRVYRVVVGASGDDGSALVAWIRSQGGRASPREVARGAPGYTGDTARAEAALARLVRAGAARWEPTATGGRPRDTVRLI